MQVVSTMAAVRRSERNINYQWLCWPMAVVWSTKPTILFNMVVVPGASSCTGCPPGQFANGSGKWSLKTWRALFEFLFCTKPIWPRQCYTIDEFCSAQDPGLHDLRACISINRPRPAWFEGLHGPALICTGTGTLCSPRVCDGWAVRMSCVPQERRAACFAATGTSATSRVMHV